MRDLIAELETVRRRVGSAEVPAGSGHLVELRRVYEAPVEDVWDACTDPERVGRWFLPLTGDLRLGGRYQLEGNAGGQILECRPPDRLAVTWVFGDAETLVELDLTGLDEGGTELRLRHAVSDDEHWAQYGPGATGVGWDLTLLGLEFFLSTGEPAPDAIRLGTDPLVPALMRRSALEWGTAHEAAGAPSAHARDAAARTSAAYAPDPQATPG